MSVSFWWRRNYELLENIQSLKIAGNFATSVWWKQVSWNRNQIMEELLCGCEHSRGFVFGLWFLSLPSLLNLPSRKIIHHSDNSESKSFHLLSSMFYWWGGGAWVVCFVEYRCLFLDYQYANAFTYFMDKSGRDASLELHDSFPEAPLT